MDRIPGLILSAAFLTACASSPPPKPAAPAPTTTSAASNRITVGHPMDSVWTGYGTYVFIRKDGNTWRVVSIDSTQSISPQLRDPKQRLAREGELLLFSEDLRYVRPEFTVRETAQSAEKARQGLYTCFMIGFDDDSKNTYPNACNSDLTSSVEQLKNTAKQVAGAALTLGISAIAANKTRAVDPEKVWAALDSANVIPQVTHYRYVKAFEAAQSSKQLQAFIDRYRNEDADALVPQAQVKLTAVLEKERLDAERRALEAKAAAELRARNEARAEQARQQRIKEEEALEEQRQARVVRFRQSLRAGDESHCGLVIEVKPPLVKLQTMVGEYWMRINQVYSAGDHNCRFYNGKYVD